ncbi:hypothetical protein RUM43_004395 [Polyplax serrata]|uniref:Uncharacterized protein n=1 Tax=Polyplax serrata TaxID=468196 RepID=A0AAN8XL36_POLSC
MTGQKLESVNSKVYGGFPAKMGGSVPVCPSSFLSSLSRAMCHKFEIWNGFAGCEETEKVKWKWKPVKNPGKTLENEGRGARLRWWWWCGEMEEDIQRSLKKGKKETDKVGKRPGKDDDDRDDNDDDDDETSEKVSVLKVAGSIDWKIRVESISSRKGRKERTKKGPLWAFLPFYLSLSLFTFHSVSEPNIKDQTMEKRGFLREKKKN